MQFFAFILAFLVLALSVVPCTDAGACIKEGKAKVGITMTTDQHSNDNDACSPFCHCACCGGFSINYAAVPLTANNFFLNDHKCIFLTSGAIEVILPIWQPPRFC